MTTLVISDLHAPYQHPGAVDFLADLSRRYRPNRVVCIGDEIDAYGWSSHPHDPDADSPKEELTKAVQTLKLLYRIFPTVYVCNSNHVERHIKRRIESHLPSQFMQIYRNVIQAPKGWQWADAWYFQGVRYQHGTEYRGPRSALDAMLRNRCRSVIGHTHAWAGIAYHSNHRSTLWGMNVGCLVDADSIAMRYGKRHPNGPVLGAGVVLPCKTPVFVPMRG